MDYKVKPYTSKTLDYNTRIPAKNLDTRIKLYEPSRPIKDIPPVRTYDTKPPDNIKARTYEMKTYDTYAEYVPSWSRGRGKKKRKQPPPKSDPRGKKDDSPKEVDEESESSKGKVTFAPLPLGVEAKMDESMEMERDAIPPPVKKKQGLPDFKMDMASLTNKLTEHMESTSAQTFLPDLVAKLAVPIYFFTITTTWYLGMFEVMPVLYQGPEDSQGLLLQRVFMVMLYLQMMVNWVCIRYVDCSFVAYLQKHWERKGKGKGEGAGGKEKGEEEDSLMSLLENSKENGFHGRGGGSPSLHPQENGLRQVHSKTPWKPPFRPPQQTVYPYWSWVPCYICEVMRPPRCHHCPICQTCVLKRDHHCFFAGSCVGWRNQRHFLVFGVWAMFGCSYATYYGFSYFLTHLWPWMRWCDLFAPVTTVRWLMGYVSGMACLCVWVQSLLLYFILLSTTFVNEHLQLICKGLTSFEVSSLKKTVELRDCRRLGAKFRAVMGKWWLLNLLLPLHWIFDAQEDPENWPSIKVYRH
ncbi:hypothetical protein ACOMHN_009398 [Nucella lapillus]